MCPVSMRPEVLAREASNVGWVALEARERLLGVLADLAEPRADSPAQGQCRSGSHGSHAHSPAEVGCPCLAARGPGFWCQPWPPWADCAGS